MGQSFSAVIEKELDGAYCVVVLWSSASIESEWVLNEAAEGARRKILVPVRIEDVRPPLEFRRLQTASLFDPNALEGPEFEACVGAIRGRLQRSPPAIAEPSPSKAEVAEPEKAAAPETPLPEPEPRKAPSSIRRRMVAAGVSTVVILLLLVIVWRSQKPNPSVSGATTRTESRGPLHASTLTSPASDTTHTTPTSTFSIHPGTVAPDSLSRLTNRLPASRSKKQVTNAAERQGEKGDVTAPVLLSRVEPLYTEVARKARITGSVTLETTIDANGDVRDVRVLKSLPFGLDQSAIDAVRQWKFRPATRNGRPVSVLFKLTVNFHFKDDKEQAPAQ